MISNEIEKLDVGDRSSDLKLEIVDKDRLCFLVKTESRGSYGVRTISKQLLQEFVGYFRKYPEKSANDARNQLTGRTDLDKFEYGYAATLTKLAKMVINPETECIHAELSEDSTPESDYVNFKHILEYFCTHLQYIAAKEDITVKGYSDYIEPFVDAGTFRKSGQGYNGDYIQNQIQRWEQTSHGKICISVHGQWCQGPACYLHWAYTPHNVLAKWDNEKIQTLQLAELDEKSGNRSPLEPSYTLDELGLYDGKEPNENLKKFYDAFADMLKNDSEQEEMPEELPVEPLAFVDISPRQIIYYGAPGTGKSHTIKKEEDAGLTCIRTTFHPDSDYSTFVGCYKPHKCRETDTLTYEFVPQAFLEAYTQAWLNPQQEIALVIEEINRGNCAQIFGDIFQLLDRDKDGWSTYPIKADTDIAEYLDQMEITGYSETMAKRYGESKAGYGYLALPPNMSILATMNTSDQSLFPIDSAFKRRWDWKYVKIKPGKDKMGNQLNWKIVIKDEADNVVKVGEQEEIAWWTFIEKINEIIASMTSSADKQLGYFFCKPTEKAEETDEEPSIITADTLVGKVIFYLWNDVFKDYGFEDAYLFNYIEKVEGKDMEKDLTFADFYDEEGENVNTTRLADFLGKVLTWQKNNEGKE